MTRPKVCRCVKFKCKCNLFSPGGSASTKDEISLEKCEIEAIRLKDFKNLDQGESARKMKVSQPTFFRILDSARKKLARALIEGKAIRIDE